MWKKNKNIPYKTEIAGLFTRNVNVPVKNGFYSNKWLF